MKNLSDIQEKTIIKGKWHQKSYEIQKKLGSGANGVVYLAIEDGVPVALKISENNVTVTSEVNVLKSLSKAQGVSLGPSLLDVDDWVYNNQIISFYAMEYIKGLDFLSFVKNRGNTWVEILLLQLLSDLEQLHKEGWVFGDLKPENLIVVDRPIKIRCVDVGGTTIQGRAIKEYTEFFDRGYWGLGSRKAEISYDLFAVAMIMINAYYPQRFTRKSTDASLSQLQQVISLNQNLKKHERVLLNALQGRYHSAEEMRKDLVASINNTIKTEKKTTTSYSKKLSGNKQRRSPTPIRKKQNAKRGMVETIILLGIVSIIYAIYIFEQIM